MGLSIIKTIMSIYNFSGRTNSQSKQTMIQSYALLQDSRSQMEDNNVLLRGVLALFKNRALFVMPGF